MRDLVSLLILGLILAGCTSPTPTAEEGEATEVAATEALPMTAAATLAAPTEVPILAVTPLPLLERYEAITPPPLNAAAFSPDGTRLAYVSTVGITMLDAANEFAVLWEAPLVGVESFGLAWSADGEQLVTMRAMERQTGQNAFTSVTRASVLTIDASDGRVIHEAPSDGVRIPFNLNGQRIGAGSRYWLNPAALSMDGARYAVPGLAVTLGDSETGEEQSLNFAPPFDEASLSVMGLAFSDDGRLFAASAQEYGEHVSLGGTVQVWRLDGLETLAIFNVRLPGAIAFSPDGLQLAVLSGWVLGGPASGLHVFDLTTGEEMWSQFGEFNTLAWSEFGIYTELGGRLVRYHPETGNRYEREGLIFPAYLGTTWLEASEYGVLRVTPEYLHLMDAESMGSRVLANGFLPVGDVGLDASSYREVATYAPDGSAVALRSHSYIWVRSAESTYWKGIEGVGALAWSPDSQQIAVASGEEIAIWEAWGALVKRIPSPIPVQEVFWAADNLIVVAGNVGTYPEQVGGWDVAETALAGIDIATGEVKQRGGFSAVRHVSAAAHSGLMVIEQQLGAEGNWHLMNFDAEIGYGNSAGRLDNALNFPVVISPDGTRVILRDHAKYKMLDGELSLINEGAGAAPGAIQWAADSGSVMAMTGTGHYYVWDREMGLICQKNARVGIDGLAQAINPTWSDVIFETQQRVLEVWRLHDPQKRCE